MASEAFTALQRLSHPRLLEIGFERVNDSAHYRAYIQSPSQPDELHAIFISLGDTDPAIMSPFGDASSITEHELTLVRNPNDHYELITVDSLAAFHRPYASESIAHDLDQIIADAIQLGHYAATVEYKLSSLKQEKAETLARLQNLINSDNWDIVHSGQVSSHAFVVDVERILALIPEKGLWQTLTGVALRASIWNWANTPNSQMGDSPWSSIADSLVDIGKARGWELEAE